MADIAGHIDVEALGITVRIKFRGDTHLKLREEIARSWEGARQSARREPDAVVESPAIDDPALLQERLTAAVTLKAMERRAGELLLFHACGVALPDGRVVAFVGPSGRGKSTLARELGRRFGYVSDETIGVDAAGMVHPHRKPLSMKREAGPKWQLSPRDAGLLPLPEQPLRLAALVLLDRRQDPTEPCVEVVPLLEGIAALTQEMSYLARMSAPLRRIASLCAQTGGVRRLIYSDVDSLTALVPSILASGPAEPWEPGCRLHEAPGSLVGDRVVDAIKSGDRAAVLTEGRLTVLDGIAPTIWAAVASGAGPDGILEAVIAAHGLPPEGEARGIVQAVLAELVAMGLIRDVPFSPAACAGPVARPV